MRWAEYGGPLLVCIPRVAKRKATIVRLPSNLRVFFSGWFFLGLVPWFISLTWSLGLGWPKGSAWLAVRGGSWVVLNSVC